MTIARWIDLGCPINVGDSGDAVRLVPRRSPPDARGQRCRARAGTAASSATLIRIGVADADSGLAPGSLSITADFAMAGRAAGAELADLAQVAGDGIWSVPLSPPLTDVQNAHLWVAVADQQGNVTREDRRFSVGAGPAPTPTFAPPQPTPTPAGGGGHDSSVTGLRRAKRVRLREGVEARTVRVRIKVRNEDVVADRGGPGHEIRLVASAGDCPPGVVTVAPDFVSRTAGSQDRIVVRAGKRKTATVTLQVESTAFFTPGDVPARCQIALSAVGPGVDPTPANNVTAVVLEVEDDGDR